MPSKKKDALMKTTPKVLKDVVLKGTSTHQRGMSGYETIAAALAAYSATPAPPSPFRYLSSPNPMASDGEDVPLGAGGTAFEDTPAAVATEITGSGTVALGNFPDVEESLALLADSDDDYTPSDVDIPCDAARTAILNATRSIAEINFRRTMKSLSLASIYGATRGTIAKYFDALTKLRKDIESGIVAGEHEFLQGKISEAQVKANLVGGKLGPRATVIASVTGDRVRAFITNATNEQDTLAKNGTLVTQAAISSASDTERIRASYNNFLATAAQIEGQHDRAVGSIIAACVSQTGAPGLSYVSVT